MRARGPVAFSVLLLLALQASCRSGGAGQGPPAQARPEAIRPAAPTRTGPADAGANVPVQRMLAVIETSIRRGLSFVVLEPDDAALWLKARRTTEDYLERVWRDGGLLGSRPEEAYFVRCDGSTMTQADVAAGLLVCAVGVAPVKPAEFVVFRVSLPTASAGR
jgi:phage tail sheath protein FI